MPRAGLDSQTVVAAAAALADEVGFAHVTMGELAQRLGVRTPSLYKHVDSQAAVNRQVAVLALTELGDRVRDVLAGRSGRDALGAAARTMRAYVVAHPGRYAATIGITAGEDDEKLVAAGARLVESLSAILAGYGLPATDTVHALRLLRSLVHGFAVLEAAGGFAWDVTVDDSFEWLIDFIDRGLAAGVAGARV